MSCCKQSNAQVFEKITSRKYLRRYQPMYEYLARKRQQYTTLPKRKIIESFRCTLLALIVVVFSLVIFNYFLKRHICLEIDIVVYKCCTLQCGIFQVWQQLRANILIGLQLSIVVYKSDWAIQQIQTKYWWIIVINYQCPSIIIQTQTIIHSKGRRNYLYIFILGLYQ